MVIECVMNQYYGFNSAGRVVCYLTFRELMRVEAQDCRATGMTSELTVGSKKFLMTPGTTISHSTFLHDDLTDNSYSSNSMLEFPGSHKIGGQVTRVVYKITVLEVMSR